MLSEQPHDHAFQYLYKGAFTMLKVRLPAGGSFKAESDAMVAMSPTIDVEGKLEGGVLGGLGRMLSGEKFFFQTLRAARGPGEVLLAPAIPGDLHHLELDGSVDYVLQKDGFFAGSDTLTIGTKAQNLSQGLLSGEGFFVLRVSGQGTLFVSSYGAIHPIDLAEGEQLIVDNAHLVAWPGTMRYNVEKASKGWISSFTSGEGIVCRFTGPGRILIQSRNPGAFAAWIRGMLPPPRR
ncbi:MAG: TIGR00266 family protein [Pseudomonadota bacterium]